MRAAPGARVLPESPKILREEGSGKKKEQDSRERKEKERGKVRVPQFFPTDSCSSLEE